MYRFIERKLIDWKEQQNRKPLTVRGARQVGKTYSITEFGDKHFSGTIHRIDLEKRPDLHAVFKQNLDVKRIIAELELLLNVHIEPGRDLLFFDEIQSCPRAIMALRYFYKDMPNLHVIAAGSLLKFSQKDISFPVGRIQFLEMYPMSFEESLIAQGKNQAIELIDNFPERISDSTHKYLLEELRKYFFVGGMTECVKTFIETNKFQEVFDIQTSLIETIKENFPKYAPLADKQCLNTVLLNVARSVGKKLVYTHLAEGVFGAYYQKSSLSPTQSSTDQLYSLSYPGGTSPRSFCLR